MPLSLNMFLTFVTTHQSNLYCQVPELTKIQWFQILQNLQCKFQKGIVFYLLFAYFIAKAVDKVLQSEDLLSNCP